MTLGSQASFAPLSTGVWQGQYKNMKVVFIDVYNRIPIASGGDWWNFQLCTDLARNNNVSTFYTFEKGSREGYQPEDISFATSFLTSRIDWSRLSMWLEILRPDKLWDREQIRDITADVVVTLVYGYHIAAYIAKKNKAPIILVMQNVEWQYVKSMGSLWYLPIRTLENWILSRVDAVITISQPDYDYAVKHTHRERVFYIPPKPDVNIFNPHGPRHEFGRDRLNVLFYGSLDRQQNQAALTFIKNELIPAFAQQRLNGAFKVHVFGSGKIPNGLLSGTDINFVGAVSDPGFYIRGADVIIVPIRNASGLKLRMIESLACGKPIVATPEAVEGLPAEVRGMIYVADTADCFVETLKGIRAGTLPNKANPPVVLRHMQGDSIDEVVNHALKKTPKVPQS